ncbi:MAG: O-antigen ligase family protein [Schwartzia sp.]|nr:O-antigen ligase family protein [Schwartzia sp. (in: firmicutes)]
MNDVLQKNKTLTYLFFAMIGAICISFFASENPVWSMRVFGDHYFYRMCGFYMVLMFVREKGNLLRLLEFAALSCFLNGIHCLWEFVALGNTRANGFYFYMTTGTMFAMWTPLVLLAALEAFEKKKYRVVFSFALVFMIAVQFCNQTRGAWVATALTSIFIIFMFMRNKKKAVAVFLALAVAVGIVFACVPQLNHRMSSIADVKSGGDRILLWTSSYNMFSDHPVLGIGYNQFKDKYQNQYILPEAKERYLMHAHNNFVQVLAEGGMLGTATWSLFWGYALWLGLCGWKKNRNLAYLAWFAIIAGMQLHGLTEYTQGNSATMKEFWFLMGIFLQLIWLSEQDKRRKLS